MTTTHPCSFFTRVVHLGEPLPDSRWAPVVEPIHPSVSYTYPSMDELEATLGAAEQGYVYHRYGNPTVAAFEAAMAALEGGEAAIAFASGMAAIHTALLAAIRQPRIAIVAALDLYGATHTLVNRLFSQLGVAVRTVDVTDVAGAERALALVGGPPPAVLLVETISNPLLKVADLPALAQAAQRHGAWLLVDNTFASPWLCNPLAVGADMVVHSATKAIAGHGDVMAGVVVTSAEKRRTLLEVNKMVGGVLGPFEAWLALRGLRTLALRQRQQCANAQLIAEWLTAQPWVAGVHYPGLADHPQHLLATRLFRKRGYGSVLSFDIADADKAQVFRFMEALRICRAATSLGDIYTMVLHPATASHRGLTAAERARAGIGDQLVRLSAGIEDPADLVADLQQAADAM